jgi:hypothetical protein
VDNPPAAYPECDFLPITAGQEITPLKHGQQLNPGPLQPRLAADQIVMERRPGTVIQRLCRGSLSLKGHASGGKPPPWVNGPKAQPCGLLIAEKLQASCSVRMPEQTPGEVPFPAHLLRPQHLRF